MTAKEFLRRARNVDRRVDEAVKALKAQEPIKASVRDSDGGITHWYVCEHCQAPIQPGDNFCHDCGKAVNWE